MKKYNIAIIGARGNVGSEVVKVLEQVDFPVENIYPVTSNRSVGEQVMFKGQKITTITFDDLDIKNVDIIFNAAGSKFAREYLEDLAKNCLVIDKSSYFRQRKDIPLRIPSIQSKINQNKIGLVSIPNCITIPIAMVIDKIRSIAIVEFCVASTYQSISGAGKTATSEFYRNTKKTFEGHFLNTADDNILTFNCVPQIGTLEHNGYTSEENKIINECKKLISEDLNITATSVRVPVFKGHAISLTIGLESEKSAQEIENLFEDDEHFFMTHGLVTHKSAANSDAVYISRLRKDLAFKYAFSMYIVSDNLRVGAALSAVRVCKQILGI